jgi:hypothetical protein
VDCGLRIDGLTIADWSATRPASGARTTPARRPARHSSILNPSIVNPPIDSPSIANLQSAVCNVSVTF